jgi:hypothetical protein
MRQFEREKAWLALPPPGTAGRAVRGGRDHLELESQWKLAREQDVRVEEPREDLGEHRLLLSWWNDPHGRTPKEAANVASRSHVGAPGVHLDLLGPAPVRGLQDIEHARDLVGVHYVFHECSAYVDANPLEHGHARVARDPEPVGAVVVLELVGEAKGGQVQQVVGVANHEAQQPGARGGVDVAPLRVERRELAPAHVGRSLRELEGQSGDKGVVLRGGHALETSCHVVRFPYTPKFFISSPAPLPQSRIPSRRSACR